MNEPPLEPCTHASVQAGHRAHLNAFGQGEVDDKTDIGLVYAHAKGNLRVTQKLLPAL